MSLQGLLDQLYAENDAPSGGEKNASDRFFEGLQPQAGDNPYEHLSDQQLMKLAEQEFGDEAGQDDGVSDELLEKLSADAAGGKVMAHAFHHESELIKQAEREGVCRVCKEQPYDVEGQTICSACDIH